MVNNKKINNYYKKKKSPKQNQSVLTAEGETMATLKNEAVQVPIENDKNKQKLTVTEGTKPSSLALAAAVISPTTKVNSMDTNLDIVSNDA
jgi:hypothetical protein